MTWNDYFIRHAEEAERKAQVLSGFACKKQKVVAETFRSLASDRAFIERAEDKPRLSRSALARA